MNSRGWRRTWRSARLRTCLCDARRQKQLKAIEKKSALEEKLAAIAAKKKKAKKKAKKAAKAAA